MVTRLGWRTLDASSPQLGERARAAFAAIRSLYHANATPRAAGKAGEAGETVGGLANESRDGENGECTEILPRVCHEIRNPASTIIGYADLLLSPLSEGLDEAEKRASLAAIKRGAEAIVALTDDFLDIAQLRSGNVTIRCSSFVLGDLIHSLKAMVHHQIAEKGLSFHVTLEDGLAASAVEGDERRLCQILTNLISNAVKFTHPGGSICLAVVGEWGERGFAEHEPQRRPRRLAFKVTDTGVGIRKADQERLFRPYVQLPAGRTRLDGHGLGLAISMELARAMGGTIEVESEEGHGSAFSLSVPC